MILFPVILFKKAFLACNDCFGLFSKIKKGSGALAFGAYFLHNFSIKKYSTFNTLSIDKVSMSHLISFSKYQTKCVIKFYLDS